MQLFQQKSATRGYNGLAGLEILRSRLCSGGPGLVPGLRGTRSSFTPHLSRDRDNRHTARRHPLGPCHMAAGTNASVGDQGHDCFVAIGGAPRAWLKCASSLCQQITKKLW